MFLNSQNQYKKYAIDSILKEISETHQTEWGGVCVCVAGQGWDVIFRSSVGRHLTSTNPYYCDDQNYYWGH